MLKRLYLWIAGVILILGMAACSLIEGEKTDDSIGGNPAGQGSGDQSSTGIAGAESTESGMQYAYSGTVIDFAEYGSDVAVCDIAGRGDRVYVLLEIREWGEEPEDNALKPEYTSHYQVFSCMADGSGRTVSGEIHLPEGGGYVNDLQLSDDGCVAALFYSDTDDAVSLLFRDVFRDVCWEKRISSGGYLFFSEDGFVLLAGKGEGRVVNFYDARGELTDSVEADGEIFRNFQDCYFMPDNRFLVTATDYEGAVYAEFYDPKNGQTERRMLPDTFSRYHGISQYQVFQGTAADILLCDSVGVYQLDLERNVSSEMLIFVDADLDISGFQMVWQIDGTRLAGVFGIGGAPKLGLFDRTEAPEGERRQMVTLGIMGELDAGLRGRIIAFNQENSRYRLTIKQYVTYEEGNDALTRLNADILSGGMPDILLVDKEMPLQSYIAKGLLADVGELLEKDGELDSGQLMGNILDAFRVDGTLYYVVPTFCVDTLVAKRTMVGDRTGWNQEEFSAALAGLSEGTEMVSETSRYDYLGDYMRVCGREYVDTDQGRCNFQSEDFVSALKFAATLPEYAESYFYEENCYDSRYIEDRALLKPVTIRHFPELAQQIYGCMGEDIAYVGYPSESREGSCIRISGMGFVLSGRSDRLEGAWEFVRYFLTADFQRDGLYGINGGGLPIRKDVFGEKAQRAATQEGYCFINDEYFPVLPMTQEQIDRAVGFIGGLHNSAFEDEVVMNIIYEEAESFFRGQRTAEDVAGLIQNRVGLYLGEGR